MDGAVRQAQDTVKRGRAAAMLRCPYCRAAIDAGGAPRRECPSCARDLSWLRPETNFIIRGVDLWRLGRGQRIMNAWGVVFAVVYFVAMSVPPASVQWQHVLLDSLLCAAIVPFCGAGIGVHHMYAALHGTKDKNLWPFSVALTLFHVFTFVIMNILAMRAFRRRGLRWRVQGWTNDQLLEIFRRPFCHGCGYDLTGNASGRCPECGWRNERVVSRPVQQRSC